MNPYTVLNVSETVSDDALKKAYRTKCKQYHPDLNPNNAVAEEKFKEVQSAYQMILDIRAGKRAPFGQSSTHSAQGTYSYNPQWQAGQQWQQSGPFRTYYYTTYQQTAHNPYEQQTQQPYQRKSVQPRFSLFRLLFVVWAIRMAFNVIGGLMRSVLYLF